MEKVFECQSCRNNYTAKYYFLAPFCSERCETRFLDHAPVNLIDKVYSDHKKELAKQNLENKSIIEKEIRIEENINKQEEHDFEIDSVYCEYCGSIIDYGYIDDRVIKVCSELCSEMFLSTLQ